MGFARVLLMTILVALGMSAAFAAAAQPANVDVASAVVPAPQWRPGSTWEYSDGYGVLAATTVDGATIFERLDAPGQWFSMRGFLRQDAASATTKRQTIYRTVPPGAGDQLSASAPLTFQREYLSNNKLIVHASSWTVEGRERITVPAGTFDCWVVVWRARSLKSNWTGFERWWYSPEAQAYVRMEYKYGASATASRVLMRYRLAEPDEAPAVPIAAEPDPASDPGSQAADADPAAASAIKPVVVGMTFVTMPSPMPLAEIAIDETLPQTPIVAIQDSPAPTVAPTPKRKVAISSKSKPKARRKNSRRR